MWRGGEIVIKCLWIIMKVFVSIVFLIGFNCYSYFLYDFVKEKGSWYEVKMIRMVNS